MAGPPRVTLKKAWNERVLYGFIVPALLLVIVFSYAPAFSALQHAFYEWNGGDQKEFTGLKNFQRLLGDWVFWESFITISILVVANVFKLIPSILIAVLIHHMRNDRARYFYRIAVVLPMIVPGIVTLFIWKFFLDPNFGLLNTFLDITGLKGLLVHLDQFLGLGAISADLPINWLGTPQLVLPSLIIWGFPWIGTVGVLVYLAGLENIPEEVYESAKLDGAGPVRVLVSIELPLILSHIRITLILLVIGTLQSYGQQFLLLGESGGPSNAGMTPGLWMFNRAFFAGEFGYACALGLVLFFFILFLTVINNKFVRVDK